MIILKSEREIKMMAEAGKLLADCHKKLAKLIQPGITTMEINDFVAEYLKNTEQNQNKMVTVAINTPPVHLSMMRFAMASRVKLLLKMETLSRLILSST